MSGAGEMGCAGSGPWTAAPSSECSAPHTPLVKAEKQGDEYAGDDNVPQAKHGVLGAKNAMRPKVFGENHCVCVRKRMSCCEGCQILRNMHIAPSGDGDGACGVS